MMPYIQRLVPQSLDSIDPGVIDVYHSPSVYVNNVPVALWEAPIQGNSALSALAMPPAPPVYNYAPSQAQLDNYRSNQELAALNPVYGVPDAGSDVGQQTATTGGGPPGTNTSDPNDQVGNPPELGSPITLAAGDTVWGRLENFLNKCLEESARGDWREKTPPGSVAPNYVANPNIMNAFAQVGFPKNVLDSRFPGPSKGAPGDQVYWCAAFAGYVLKAAGATYLQSLTAPSYAQAWKCTRINPKDPRAWRRNDLVFFGFSHVSFIREIKNGRVWCTGGNQGNSVNNGPYPFSDVAFVGRQWEVPAEYDKPLL